MAKERFGVLSEEQIKAESDADALGGELRRQQSSFDTATVRFMSEQLGGLSRAAEELDRYDDFSALRISSDKYEHTYRTGDYGIRRRAEVQGSGEIILAHQRSAALRFLRELRGFGLLADVVGSGKTYEAGVVLSELAVRGKVSSLLLVVPDQVYDTWVDVMEKQFGMGEGVLLRAGGDPSECVAETESAGAFLRPLRPIIVRTDDFAAWPQSADRYLFDVIVVDEAHHLCATGGRYARAMKMLSRLMQTKKSAGSTYCLLLTATPHTGNLANMFRLWYFIRCHGGVPSDFDEKEDYERTEEYLREKRHYTEDVCRGASTVLEFIKKVKLQEISAMYGGEFGAYLAACGVTPEKYAGMTEGEKASYADDFLRPNAGDGEDVSARRAEMRKAVFARIASAYHNGILRSVMIRQARNPLAERKRKYVRSRLYLPTRAVLGETEVALGNYGRLTVDLASLARGGEVTVGGEKKPLRAFLNDYSRATGMSYKRAYAELMRQIFGYFCDRKTLDFPEDIFEKGGSASYYLGRLSMADSDPDQETEIVPVGADEDTFALKFADAKRILRENVGRRVLVFFDYEAEKEKTVSGRFLDELRADPEFSERVIAGSRLNAREAADEFSRRSDAVLVVTDASLTEGANLQSCNVILNFQVTPDPLAMDQRIGRIFRLGQDSDVTIYSLAMMNELEGYALMYFSGIGLLSAGSGDATIISGSNSERMVAVRCPVCGNVLLYSAEDYEAKKKSGGLFCKKTQECYNMENPLGTPMDEISVWDFRCDGCGNLFTRSAAQEGYFCMSQNTEGGIMCNSGARGDRSVYCRKICAVAHCRMFTDGARRDCAALARYREKGGAVSNLELMSICESCGFADVCCGRIAPGADALAACSACDNATCFPRPGTIRFDGRWEADCPVCAASGRHGRLRRVTAHTFAAYLRAAWNFKGDRVNFCYNLENEVKKGAEVRDVLRMDGDVTDAQRGGRTD